VLVLSSSQFDPERTLIAEERPRQRGSEYGLRAGDSELNRCHIRRAKVGSRQFPGPIALRKGDGENARPLLCRTTRKRSFQLRPPSHSGPSSNDSFSHATLTTAEKRAILSSWASDACAVESMPALRQILGSGHVVKFDEVIDALQELDGKAGDICMEEPQRRHRGPDRGSDPEEGPSGTGFWY
jgi:hypothetical protein